MTTPPGPEAARRLTLQEIAQAKRDGRPLVMVTAYDYPSGRIAERAGVDLVLVGDSGAMTVLGHSSTVPATMDEMIMLTGAVSRACRRALVIADLPFMSYQVSDEDALRAAGRFLKEAAAQAVKLEGAGPMLGAHPRAGGSGNPRRRPSRPDSADGDLAGRLPRAGQDRTGGAAPAARRARRRGGGRIPARARGRAGTRRGTHQQRAPDPDDRHRGGRRLRRAGAGVPRPAWTGRRAAAALRRALRRARRPRRGGRGPLRRRRARAALPAGAPHLRDRRR